MAQIREKHRVGVAVTVGTIATKTRIRSAVYYHSPEKECEPLRTESAQLDDVPSADFILEHDAAARK